MILTGGLRRRLVKDSLYHTVDNALDALGWYDSGRKHLPINFLANPVPNDQEIPLNTLVLSDEDEATESTELGSVYDEFRWTFYLDFYAENSSIAVHMTGDLVDILKGKLPSVGRSGPSFDVYNYTAATPSAIFRCDIDNIVRDRAHEFPRPWQRHWYVVRFDVYDEYGDENDEETNEPIEYYGGY